MPGAPEALTTPAGLLAYGCAGRTGGMRLARGRSRLLIRVSGQWLVVTGTSDYSGGSAVESHHPSLFIPRGIPAIVRDSIVSPRVFPGGAVRLRRLWGEGRPWRRDDTEVAHMLVPGRRIASAADPRSLPHGTKMERWRERAAEGMQGDAAVSSLARSISLSLVLSIFVPRRAALAGKTAWA